MAWVDRSVSLASGMPVDLRPPPSVTTALPPSTSSAGEANATEAHPVCRRCRRSDQPLAYRADIEAVYQLDVCGACIDNGICELCHYPEESMLTPVGAGLRACEGCATLLRCLVSCPECSRRFVPPSSQQPEICSRCYTRKRTRCSQCGAMGIRRPTEPDGVICSSCHTAARPLALCSGPCGQTSPQPQEGQHAGTGLPLCRQCFLPLARPDTLGCVYRAKEADDMERHVVCYHRGARSRAELIFSLLLQGLTPKVSYLVPGVQPFTQRDAPNRPLRGPAPWTFWHNVRPWIELVGKGGQRLECDFILGLPGNVSMWVELQGPHHYMVMPAFGTRPAHTAERLALVQAHDQRKRQFVQQGPPFPGLVFCEVPFHRFQHLDDELVALLHRAKTLGAGF